MQQEQTNNADQTINDLTVTETEQAEIKGGPKKIFIGGLSVKETAAALPDLEPSGEIKGGPGSGAGGVWMNHNETVAADEVETESLDDLPVNDDQEAQVIGGRIPNIKHPELVR